MDSGYYDDLNMKYGKTTNQAYLPRDSDFTKSYKYRTTTFDDLSPKNLTELSKGLFYDSGYGINPELIDEATKLERGTTVKRDFDSTKQSRLLTTPGLYRGNVNIDIESQLRASSENNKKSCQMDNKLHFDRTMTLFSDDIPSPYRNASDFVTENITSQYGVSTRRQNTKKYDRRNSNFNPNPSYDKSLF